METMRALAFLIAVILIPQASALIYSPSHNITYHLNDKNDNAGVEEEIKIALEPYSIEEPLYYPLPRDAYGVEVSAPERLKYRVDYDVDAVLFDFFHVPQRRFEVGINYSRGRSIFSRGEEKIFSAQAYPANIPWTTYEARVAFQLPESYSFGNLTPGAQREQKSGTDVAIYALSLRNNISLITSGMKVEVPYANYRKLTENRITVLKARENEALLAFKEANSSLENALGHGLNSSTTLALYRKTEEEVYQYLQEVKAAQTLRDYGDYSAAYRHLERASHLLRNASIHSREVNRQATTMVQKYLESRIDKISNLSERRGEKPEQEDGTPVEGFNLNYLFLLAIPLALFLAYLRGRARPREPERKGKVSEYGVIADLKKKEYSGFDEKVKKIKESSEISSEIRRLDKLKKKYELGLENLEKKLISGEINDDSYRKEKKGMKEEINSLEEKISMLNRRLAQLRSKREGKRKSGGESRR